MLWLNFFLHIFYFIIICCSFYFCFLKRIQFGPLQNIKQGNTTVALVENTEPDGNIDWEECLIESESDFDSDSSSSSSKSVSTLAHEEPECHFSNMYGNNQIKDNKLTTYDPPASNTRRRKKNP